MKRYALGMFVLFSWLALIGAGGAQSITAEGWPPQAALFNDALFLARATPFIIAAGIVVGIMQARASARSGGDAILGEEVRRHDTGTVLTHWLNAVGLIISLVSGAIVLRWVERPPQERLIFVIHYLGAGLILFAIFNHLSRSGVSGGMGLIPRNLKVIRDLIGELLEYAGLFGPKGAALRIPIPRAIRQPIAIYARALLGYKESETGKYLSTEKTLSYPPWATLITLITVTGLIKVMRYIYPMPGDFIASVTALHDLVAIGIGVMLIIHLLPLLLVPANWPLLLSMFRTTVSRKYVEERHPVWYKELLAKRKAQPQAAASETGPEQNRAQTPAETLSKD